ncbi:MAG: hypothetical protein ABH837_03090 [bacterium]
MKKLRQSSYKFEADQVKKNPDYVGINFDQDLIVDARSSWTKQQWQDYLKLRDNKIPSIGQVEAQKILIDKKQIEEEKLKKFQDYLKSFFGKLQYVRINPAGEASPISPSQAINIQSGNKWLVAIEPRFLEQLNILVKNGTDMIIVVPFYNHRQNHKTASDVPKTVLEKNQYLAICETLIQKIGGSIQLEVGNETNVTRSTGEMFKDKLQFGSQADAKKYAQFYYEIASQLKEKYPLVRLSLAGVACFDPKYLQTALTEIQYLVQHYNVDIKLVDSISFHPYREEPEKGSVEVRNGNFCTNKLDYKAQMDKMLEIGSDFSVDVNIGEINFSLKDPDRFSKLEKALQLTANKMRSYIYPGVNVE